MIDRRELLKAASAVALSGLMSVVPSRAAAAGSTKLLLVHGRGQQGLNPETLKAVWLATLNRGTSTFGQAVPTGIDVAFPFYGDILYNYTQQFGLPLTSEVQARGTP